MDSETLLQLAAFSQRALELNLDGFTHEQALAQPPGGNCVNWLVGHILVHRERMLAALGAPRVGCDRAAPERYDRGTAPITEDGEGVVHLGSLRETVEESGRCLAEAIRRAGTAKLVEPHGKVGTVGALLGILIVHEGYHVGQIASARHLVGMEGAIR
ncbi:MAG TPA: DinB family protein [Longimicrobium sp.]|nr:DinB family protein [Longimicrobium sp.]